MEVNKIMVVNATHDDRLNCSNLSNEIDIRSTRDSNERTPLLIRRNVELPHGNSPAPTELYLKDCLNWRSIGLLSMFIIGMMLSVYLLWRQTASFPNAGYKLYLIHHDIWSSVHLHDQTLLQAGKVVNVFVTHTASDECSENCEQLLHSLQNDFMMELPFNFLFAGDCETYEARGWQYVSSFGTLPQDSSLVFAFVGDFSDKLPISCQLQMAQGLLWESLKRLKLQSDYKLFALQNVTRSEWDADALQRHLMHWPLYAGQWKVK